MYYFYVNILQIIKIIHYMKRDMKNEVPAAFDVSKIQKKSQKR